MDLQALKEQVAALPFIIECVDIERYDFSSTKHIEVTVKSTDPGSDRAALMQFLEEHYPEHKFRAVFFKASA
jgi:hypothetical protein